LVTTEHVAFGALVAALAWDAPAPVTDLATRAHAARGAELAAEPAAETGRVTVEADELDAEVLALTAPPPAEAVTDRVTIAG
jgi:hypothetical protein